MASQMNQTDNSKERISVVNVNGGLKRVDNVEPPFVTYGPSTIVYAPQSIYFDLVRACVVEFLGTAIFVFNGS